MYYAYKSRDGHVYCVQTWDIYEARDNLLFDTIEECISYWQAEGIVIDRFI